eukprot:6919599-Prymnesium_polylepis.1
MIHEGELARSRTALDAARRRTVAAASVAALAASAPPAPAASAAPVGQTRTVASSQPVASRLASADSDT